jgi:hypothetical protein
MQSRHFVLGAAVLLAQLFPFSIQAADQQSAPSRLANLRDQQI